MHWLFVLFLENQEIKFMHSIIHDEMRHLKYRQMLAIQIRKSKLI